MVSLLFTSTFILHGNSKMAPFAHAVRASPIDDVYFGAPNPSCKTLEHKKVLFTSLEKAQLHQMVQNGDVKE